VTFKEHREFVRDEIRQVNEIQTNTRVGVRLDLSENNKLLLVPRYGDGCIRYNYRTWLTFFLYGISSRHHQPLYLDYLFAVNLLERNYYEASKVKIERLRAKFQAVVSSASPGEISRTRSFLHYQCLFAVEHEVFHFAFQGDRELKATVEAGVRDAITGMYMPMRGGSLLERGMSTLLAGVFRERAVEGWNHILSSPVLLEELACDDRAFFVPLQALIESGAAPEELCQFCVASYLATYCLETVQLFKDVTSRSRGEYDPDRDTQADAIKAWSMFSSLRTGIIGDVSQTHVRRSLPREYLSRYRGEVRRRASYLSTMNSLLGLVRSAAENVHTGDSDPDCEQLASVRTLLEDVEADMMARLEG
jgi:hypothetical protein